MEMFQFFVLDSFLQTLLFRFFVVFLKTAADDTFTTMVSVCFADITLTIRIRFIPRQRRRMIKHFGQCTLATVQVAQYHEFPLVIVIKVTVDKS